MKSLLREGRRLFEAVLAHPALSVSQRVLVLQSIVEILRYQGEYERSRSLLEERLLLLRELHEPLKEAEALGALGWTAFYQGQFEEAGSYSRAGLAIFRASSDVSGIANCLSCLALTAIVQGEYTQSLTWLQEVLMIRRALNDEVALAHCYNA